MTDKVQKIRKELLRLKEETSIGLSEHENGVEQGRMEIINALSLFLDSLQEEPVSEDLEEFALQYAGHHAPYDSCMQEVEDAVKAGAEWQKAQEYTCYEEDFEDGAKWKKEQIMKDAVDACVTDIRTYKEDNEVDFTVMYEKGIIPYEIEQEVKLIIIKED